MSAVSNDRWCCPVCGRVIVVYAASEQDTACCLRAVRERHGRAHRAAKQMPMPEQRRKPA